nr:hypothetical protein HK105_004129 [Polyrhizophydium stewartii]
MLEEERAENAQLRLENARLAEHLARCVQTMRDAANADEEAEVAMLVAGLAKENETLRSMLIASLPSKAAQAFFPAAAKASLDGSLSSAAAAVSVHRTGR